MLFGKNAQQRAQQFLASLCKLQPAELAESGDTLPRLDHGNPWSDIAGQVRDSFVELGEQAENSNRMWTAAEVRLRRVSNEHERLLEILNCLSEPVLAINHFNEIISANAQAQSLFNFTLDDGEKPVLADAVSCRPLVELLSETRQRTAPAHRHAEMEISVDGATHWFRVNCRTLATGAADADGQHGAVAVLTDITVEKTIQKRHAEFVSSASHEMKTPLASVRAYVELLLDGDAEDEETQEEFLTVIDTQAERLQRLIENLLNIARIEAGVVSVDKQSHSLNEILEQAFEVVQPSAEQKQLDLVSELSPMYMGIHADRDMILQSAINLLSNAIKYTAEGGKVTLRSRLEDTGATFEVTDTGVGLSEEDCARVFEKFYRVKKDQQMAAGTGLGLPLAKHIVEDVHGGSLNVTSQLGGGSTFRIVLPSVDRV